MLTGIAASLQYVASKNLNVINMETIMWIENYLTKAEQMVFEGRTEEALSMLNNLLFDEPGYGRLHNLLGWVYTYHVEDTAKAELHLRMAMRFDAEYVPPYLHMGNLLSRNGRHVEAIEYFNAGLKKASAIRASLLEGIAHAYELMGEYRKAIRAYREAATSSVVDFEVDRLLRSVKRCRKKRIAFLFSF